MKPIYRWNGQYFGFITNGRLFNASSQYVAWITEDGRVWRKNGTFLGEIESENYVLRRVSMASPAARATRAAPATPATPSRRANRAARASRAGRVDALEEFESA
ncbi:4-fold beta flower protein [Halopseudomonas sp.]|uniref:4-fold beta flower protein n=1 Tax=Halopseudomonas sp. TaxID=2901191 RepID=UPI003FA5D129